MESAKARPASQDGSELVGSQRIFSFVKYMFSPYDPAEKMPPMPEELKEWAQDTLLATFAGMIVGGGRQWREERSAGPLQAPAGAPTKAHAAKAMAEEQSLRLLRIVNSSLKASLRFGGIAAVFYGAQLTSAIYRGHQDFYNTAIGGVAGGAMLGSSLMAGNGVGSRGRGAILGAALGASIGVPAGMLQDYLVTLLPEDQQLRRQQRLAQTEDIVAGKVPLERPTMPEAYDPAGEVIRQLEASLAGSPTKSAADSQAEEQPKKGGKRK